MTGIGIGLFVLLIVALIILWPILVIWALNLLFGLSIPFTLGTWFAVLVLVAAVRGYNSNSKKG